MEGSRKKKFFIFPSFFVCIENRNEKNLWLKLGIFSSGNDCSQLFFFKIISNARLRIELILGFNQFCG